MWGIFYKNTEKRFSFAEYETEKEAKSAKNWLQEHTDFDFQVEELAELDSFFVLINKDGEFLQDWEYIYFCFTTHLPTAIKFKNVESVMEYLADYDISNLENLTLLKLKK